MTETYGKRRVSKMYAQINTLREAIRTEGTPAIQSAWDAVEEHIDFAYSGNAQSVETAAGVILDTMPPCDWYVAADAMVRQAEHEKGLVPCNSVQQRRLSAALRVLAGRE
jgi:hypothetical protein